MSWISHLLAICKESPIKFGRTMETQPSRDRISQATRKMFEVHIMVHFILVKQFLSAMIKSNHGHIVTVASMASFMTQAQNVDYACTKAAVLAFMKDWGRSLNIDTRPPKLEQRELTLWN
jgi:Short-chain dehydrogenases of various substrate specificities